MGSTMAEKKVIIELTELLKKNSEKVLSGETKLCLTTSSLSILASNFRRYSESTTDKDEAALDTSRKKRKGRPEDDERVWKESLRTLIDFVIKVKALKVIMGSNTMKSPIQINRFRSLQVLEVKKVPMHMLEGLSKLRGHLKEITVSKSLQTLKDLLETCGGDRTPGLVWSNLRVVYLGFNLLQKLDQSLSFIPFAEVIDLSHNSITSTDNFLMNLSDVVRINFGYNLLKSVPQFSTGNISKLKTLVLRNNNLETIDGVELLAGLEELDLAENFLIDHKVLLPLSKLKKLQVLCLTGNPLSFKDNHRLLTLKYICARAGTNGFLLDEKKLTAQETVAVSQNQFRIEQEYEREDETDGPSVDPNQDDTVLVSHLSPHGKKKKKGHRRKRSMERVPKITDVQDSMTEEVVQPSGATPSTSQIEETNRASQTQEDEEYFKTIREHYKEDWLKVLTVSQNNGQDETKQTDMSPGSVVKSDEKKSGPGYNSTSEDKILSVEINSIDRGEKRTVVEEEVIKPVRQESVSATSPSVDITATTDIYAMSAYKPNTRSENRPLFYPQHSVESHASPNEEEADQYGPESEPFIVMLPDKEMKQLFVTVNTRFLNEKDINGTKLDKLDLKYLEKIRSGEEKCYSKDIVEGIVFTVLTMNFDYTRKDLRQRRYAMESRKEAEHFESLINHHVKSQAGNQEEMECLKCQHEFIGRENSESTVWTRCPKCDSKLVIKISKPQVKITEEESVTMGTDNKDAPKPKLSRSRFGGSPFRRSVKHSNQLSDKEDNSGSGGESQGNDSGRAIEIQKRTRLNEKFSSGNSLKDYVDQLIPDDDKQDDVSEQTTSKETDLKKNLSSSELKKSSPGHTRDSLTSVESDIAVLVTNVSREGFSAISETGQSNSWLDDSAETNDQNEDSANDTHDNLAPGTSVLKDLATPVGSPLSTIVCLSMVSSVYKNTLSSNGESSDVNDSKTDEKSSFEDDLIATPIVKRRSRKSDRKSKHREVTMHDSVTKSDQADTSDDSSTIAKQSVYDIFNVSKENESFSQEKNKSTTEISIQSIYDTASSEPDLDRTDSKFESLDSSNQNTTGKSGDLLSTNQMSGSHSSPLRRRGSSRSRSNSRNRSAMYIDSSVQETSPEDQTSASNILEFPSELSPIKRTGSRRSRKNNRSAVFVDQKSEISDNLSTALSSTTNEESATTNETSLAAETSSASLQLPWEQDSSQSGDGSGRHKHESLIHDEFINIDHSIKLYLELQVFKADETAQCAIQCNIVQYMHTQKIKSLLVISTHRIMIFRYQGSSNDSDWLKCYEDQPISELQYIDIGLGYQTLRLEFGTVCSSFTLLIADEGRCKQFFTLMSDIVQKEAVAGHSQLQRITKSNPDTLENLTRDVLSTENDGEPQALVRYLMVHYQGGESDTDETKLMSLAVTESDIVLVDENHQWPLPRLQASLSEDIKGRQFTVIQREKINNIETLMFNEYNHAELRLTFFEKSSAEANAEWIISFETIKGVKLFVDAIRQPWEEEFGVSLDIKSTSCSDVDNSNTTQPE